MLDLNAPTRLARRMPKRPRPASPTVIVTRRLPESIEKRMAELFDCRFNATDEAMKIGRAHV